MRRCFCETTNYDVHFNMPLMLFFCVVSRQLARFYIEKKSFFLLSFLSSSALKFNLSLSTGIYNQKFLSTRRPICHAPSEF